MDKVYLRQMFLTQKGFLKNLQSGEQTQKVLVTANDHALDVLIRILHLIANGEIHIKKGFEEGVKKSHRTKRLMQFESKKNFWRILNDSRANKLEILRQFSKIYPFLLYSFFNEV